MKLTLLLLVPVALTTLAMVPSQPQRPTEPAQDEQVSMVRFSNLAYENLQGTERNVMATLIKELRLLETEASSGNLRLEILYENGDYSLLEVQGFHLLREGGNTHDVRLVRSPAKAMRLPRLQ